MFNEEPLFKPEGYTPSEIGAQAADSLFNDTFVGVDNTLNVLLSSNPELAGENIYAPQYQAPQEYAAYGNAAPAPQVAPQPAGYTEAPAQGMPQHGINSRPAMNPLMNQGAPVQASLEADDDDFLDASLGYARAEIQGPTQLHAAPSAPADAWTPPRVYDEADYAMAKDMRTDEKLSMMYGKPQPTAEPVSQQTTAQTAEARLQVSRDELDEIYEQQAARQQQDIPNYAQQERQNLAKLRELYGNRDEWELAA